MQLIRGRHNLRSAHRGSVLTIGNFDGVHRGHQRIVADVQQQAVRLGLKSTVMIFEPQPREFFDPDGAPARIMSLRDKLRALQQAGVDQVFCANFDQRFRSLTADEFVKDLLVDGLGAKALVIGDDFRFGCDRDGDFAFLTAAGQRYGFTVTDTPTCEWQGSRVSSTRVRSALAEGDLALAGALLGRPFSISGRVRHGDKIGRTLSLPTVNLGLHRLHAPVAGVFAVTVTGAGMVNQPGAANVGTRPSVNGVENRLEVHLLDYQEPDGQQDGLYGQHLNVQFHHFIRAEYPFDGLAALKAAIDNDVAQVRQFFRASPGH